MKKYRVTEINTTSYVYEVSAKDEMDAESKVQCGKANHLSEYDSHVERYFEFEEVE